MGNPFDLVALLQEISVMIQSRAGEFISCIKRLSPILGGWPFYWPHFSRMT